ncbi:cytochrome P450 [Podospora didyma]|uniref:Cytochrome P450 n=1 Tax=Podospora didyma TaxID=330526 RepID=A0AAE0P6Q1_9PEZI|nr:cytochrome P450 [Podospora didyma]
MVSPLFGAAVAAIVFYAAFAVIAQYGKLRHIKGPFPAAFTNLWRTKIQFVGPFQPTLHKLHKKYGSLVRIGPNTISFSDPRDVATVFSPRGSFPKADSYGTARAFINGESVGSIMTIQDEEKSKAVRRAIGNAFITKNMQDYEEDIDITINALVESLRRHAGTPINLFEQMQLFQLDTMLKMAFGENPGHLLHERDVLGLSMIANQRMWHWYAWQPVPYLERFIFQNPLWSTGLLGLLAKLSTTPPSQWAREGPVRVNARRDLIKQGVTTSHPDLLDKYMAASEKHPDAIPPETLTGLANSTIAAGADTTSSTITTIIYSLMKSPAALDRLLRELRDARLSFPVRYSTVESLPYLDAVIKEAMRMYPAFAAMLERVVPPQGCTLSGGVHIPGGTVVGCIGQVVHRNEEIYGAEPERFRPERWLLEDGETGRERLAAMERGSVAWSAGSRICLGRHIAELELKKVIPAVISLFDFKLCDPNFEAKFDMGMMDGPRTPIMVTVHER